MGLLRPPAARAACDPWRDHRAHLLREPFRNTYRAPDESAGL